MESQQEEVIQSEEIKEVAALPTSTSVEVWSWFKALFFVACGSRGWQWSTVLQNLLICFPSQTVGGSMALLLFVQYSITVLKWHIKCT